MVGCRRGRLSSEKMRLSAASMMNIAKRMGVVAVEDAVG